MICSDLIGDKRVRFSSYANLKRAGLEKREGEQGWKVGELGKDRE